VSAWYWTRDYNIRILEQLLDHATVPASCGADIAAAARFYYPGNAHMQQWFYGYCEGVGTGMLGGLDGSRARLGPAGRNDRKSAKHKQPFLADGKSRGLGANKPSSTLRHRM
jgi:hypothetical protein